MMPTTTMSPKTDVKTEVYNDFYFDGQNFGEGVHYKTLDYVPVSQFTPLSGTNWWRVDNILPKPIIENYTIDLTVGCSQCGVTDSFQQKYLRIEIISNDRNLFRVRFDPYANGFEYYNAKANTFGPITQNQLSWIKSQDKGTPEIHVDKDYNITIILKDVTMTFYNSCWMKVVSNSTGKVLHQDGWVTPQNTTGSVNQPQGIIFVDNKYGSAVAAIKSLTSDAYYYGCGECQDYYETGDSKGNHSSNLQHNGQCMTFFNYDNYELDTTELKPTGDNTHTEEAYIPQYVSAPFMVEYGSDSSYACGLLLDNTSQTYFNFGSKKYPGTPYPESTININNVYYFGSQYQGLDYYLIFPKDEMNQGLIAGVLDNFSLLTGKENVNSEQLNLRGVMPPKYIFGLFQGVFGFSGLKEGQVLDGYKSWTVESVVNGYKNNGIPLEGLAIDVDVQTDFEVFTTNGCFWDGGTIGKGKSVFEWAHDNNLVCQTNITNFIRDDQEFYAVYDSLIKSGNYMKRSKFIDFTDNHSPQDAYNGMLPYANNCFSVFPDYGNTNTPTWWGQNYWDCEQAPNALLTLGLDFVWQDMTVPAMNPHMLFNQVSNCSFNNTPGNPDLNSGQFNWKTYHGQQLYGDPRYWDQSLPYISLRNLHAYMECKATWEKGLTVDGHYPTKYQRSYIISRGGYIGLAHFGGMWTGDDASGWNYMQEELPKALNMGVCGFPITGADVGGFAPGSQDIYNHCREEMMIRWVQCVSLMPWFRDHYANFNHGGKAFQEIYNFDWAFQEGGRKVSEIMNDFIKMRVRWHHVLYNSMHKFVRSGMPLIKPTYLYEGGSNNPEIMAGFSSIQDSIYFIGDSEIMVAPALEDQNCANTYVFPTTIENHPVWFPKNKKWFPYDAEKDGPCNPGNGFNYTEGSFGYYQGDGNVYHFTVPMKKMPVFIKEGTIIPTRLTKDGSAKNIQQLDTDNEPFVFDIWPGNSGSLECYLDDGGKTKDAELQGKYSILVISRTLKENQQTITIEAKYLNYPLMDFYYLRLRGCSTGTVSDTIGNKYTEVSSLDDLYNSEGAAYFYDTVKAEGWVKYPCVSICKAGDSFQIIKQEDSDFLLTQLSFNN